MKQDSKEIESLVRAAQAGDEQAIAQLIRATQDDLYRFLLFLVRNQQLAQDFAQDTFIKALENLRSLRVPAQFRSWLFRTAKNLYLDYMRSPRSDELEPIENIIDLACDREQAEALAIVKNLLLVLSPEDRYSFLLVYLEEYTYAEVAIMIGISENALRSRLYRARLLLIKGSKDIDKKVK